MTTISESPAPLVVIPWRPAPTRVPAFERVRAWYASALPEAEIVTVDSDDDVFVLAACRNLGVSLAAPDRVVVISDADTIPEREPLRAAIAAAASSGRVHLPYDEYRWLGPYGSAQVEAGVPLEDSAFELVRGACSGVYVTTPRTWWSHGGQDPLFRGWGFEDAAWFLAHETLLGEPPRRHPGRVFALHHEPEVRAGARFEANEQRMGRYRAASGDPEAMRQLVDEGADADESAA